MIVCTTADMEAGMDNLDPHDPPTETSVRDHVLAMWDVLEQSKSLFKHRHFGGGTFRSLDDFRSLLMYSCEYPSRKKRTPMDVDAMVKRWVVLIKNLSTTHHKETIDKSEFEMDEHLTPLLTAPVKQIRQFYQELVFALQEDEHIPFFVWTWFEAWGEVILKKAPDGEVKQLKTTIATEIAELVEEDVKPDLKKALIGALQWRSPESLEKIKTAVSGGGKARMVGKESCLFLEVDLEGHTERIML